MLEVSAASRLEFMFQACGELLSGKTIVKEHGATSGDPSCEAATLSCPSLRATCIWLVSREHCQRLLALYLHGVGIVVREPDGSHVFGANGGH